MNDQSTSKYIMDSVVTENKVKINTNLTVQTPKKHEVLYNPEMKTNRSLVLCALGAFFDSGLCLNKTIRCLDAMGATGVAGLQWNYYFPQMQVTVNDPTVGAYDIIKRNCQLNEANIEVIKEDINMLLLGRPFDFIFLDCYGSSVNYLDNAFRNLPKNGVLVVTSTDDTALYGKAPDVTLRNYGGHIVKTCYAKELAARLVLVSVIRAAAKCNKGVVVLSCIAIKSCITVIVRVTRGSTPATECIHKLRKVIHCCICEDRSFYPQSSYPIEQPYSLLSCCCRTKSAGKVAVDLGPVWSGEIFDPVFCGAMLQYANSFGQSPKLISLLQTILGEAVCARGNNNKNIELSGKENCDDTSNAGRSSSDDTSPIKKHKSSEFSHILPFYFNLPRHSPKGHDLGKLSKIVDYLKQSGHRACRTHFDSEAVRTSATLPEFDQVLLDFFKSANT